MRPYTYLVIANSFLSLRARKAGEAIPKLNSQKHAGDCFVAFCFLAKTGDRELLSFRINSDRVN